MPPSDDRTTNLAAAPSPRRPRPWPRIAAVPRAVRAAGAVEVHGLAQRQQQVHVPIHIYVRVAPGA